MDVTDRIFTLHRIFRDGRVPVSRADLQVRLECSRATVARLIADGKYKNFTPAVPV